MNAASPMRRALRSERVTVPGPAGRLEGAVDSIEASPRAIAVVCHPHPLQQGTMDNKVVTTVARAFAQLGAQAVRFNFRGVGASEGRYGEGVGERADALAVIGWSRARWPSLPLYLGGFSFGAGIALAISAEARAEGLVTVAPPLDKLPADFVAPDCRWLLIHGLADDVVPFAATEARLATFSVRPRLFVLPDAGHFFHGKLAELEGAVTSFFGPDLAVTGER
ncbi:MAG TPA: alpha/beta hydrolase [Gammaproteobacteria bacterium]|nr:alpha/beta hydrolase [Gammaproteobacteria bacterium]